MVANCEAPVESTMRAVPHSAMASRKSCAVWQAAAAPSASGLAHTRMIMGTLLSFLWVCAGRFALHAYYNTIARGNKVRARILWKKSRRVSQGVSGLSQTENLENVLSMH